MIQLENMFCEELEALLPRLRRFARTLARNPHDADDLVQLALERALRHRDQWRSGTSLASWLFGILRNAFIDELRASRRRQQVFSPEAVLEQATTTSNPEPPLELDDVQDALSRLPEEQRSAVVLVLVEGLSYREAAEALQVPVGTLTSRLARGRQALAALLESD